MLTRDCSIGTLIMTGVVDFQKIVDKCTKHNGVHPAPAVQYVPGITFDKETPYAYYSNYDTFYVLLTSPTDCRWHNCYLPSSISASKYTFQMKMAISVR